MALEFKAKMYYGDEGKYKTSDVYYASGMPKKQQDICVNIGDNAQVVLPTEKVISMLKAAGRI